MSYLPHLMVLAERASHARRSEECRSGHRADSIALGLAADDLRSTPRKEISTLVI
jgi:hypothetical protein